MCMRIIFNWLLHDSVKAVSPQLVWLNSRLYSSSIRSEGRGHTTWLMLNEKPCDLKVFLVGRGSRRFFTSQLISADHLCPLTISVRMEIEAFDHFNDLFHYLSVICIDD